MYNGRAYFLPQPLNPNPEILRTTRSPARIGSVGIQVGQMNLIQRPSPCLIAADNLGYENDEVEVSTGVGAPDAPPQTIPENLLHRFA